MNRLIKSSVHIFFLLLIVTSANATTVYLGLGTGEITGVYFQAGGAIAQIINPLQGKYGLRIIVEPTSGSVSNVNAVLAGDLPFAMTQSDIQSQAVYGLGNWKNQGKQSNLRSVFSLYPESVTVIVRKDSGIRSLHDLLSKRVNLGNPESGSYKNAVDVLDAVGLSSDNVHVTQFNDAMAADMLVAGRLDALFVTIGHPSKFVEQLLAHDSTLTIIPVQGVEKLLSNSPYYTKSVIPMQFYPALSSMGDVETIGVRATLVTSAEMSEEVVYTLVKEIFENFEQFKALHPVFSTLTTAKMLEGCIAPFHTGAMKYYKSALMKK